MGEWLRGLWEEPVILLAVLASLVAIAFYVIGKIRAEAVQQEPGASELLSKFRDLHSQGDLDETEFRTIRTTLAARLQDELKDDEETG